ncbi:MAG: hypothetical protein HOQ24_17685 [Mycobacteriaceae bacterium]|nr:hypothetical protein [Mycobacteriaceae bacterium]
MTSNTPTPVRWLDRLRAQTGEVRAKLHESSEISWLPIPLVLGALVFVGAAWFVLARQGHDYATADVDRQLANAAALVSLLLVGCSAAITAVLFRTNRSLRAIAASGAFTAVIGLTFAVLPAIVAGASGLTVALTTVVTLFFYAVASAVVLTVTTLL